MLSSQQSKEILDLCDRHYMSFGMSRFSLKEDFLGGTTLFTNATSGAGATFTPISGTASHPGQRSLSTGTSNTGTVSYLTSTVLNAPILLGGGITIFETLIKFPNLSTASEEYYCRFGFSNATSITTDPVNGVFFKYDRATDGDFWSINTADNASRTKTVLSSAVVADTWYKLRIVVNADASAVEFYINDTFVGLMAANIPKTAGREVGFLTGIAKTAGTTARSISMDYIALYGTLTTAR